MEEKTQTDIKTVFVSYRYSDHARFEIVREIAAKLRFFSIRVILDQRSLLYGEDISKFMEESIRSADAMVILLSKDYNDALSSESGPGAGVRFEAGLALTEQSRRSEFQVIPILLEPISPAPPFDKLKCATFSELDQVITQLGLVVSLGDAREIAGRYRIDRLIETRGLARIFEGADLVMDLPIEIYQVPSHGDQLQGERFRIFERVLKGRSAAFSPFLLNIRDSYIDSDGAYYLITEKFTGTDLGVPLHRGQTTHPLAALFIAYQVALALYELHLVGVLHGGLAPRTIKFNREQTTCKIVDFEFARPLDYVGDGSLDGYPIICPPERFLGEPASIKQDIYQLGNLIFWLIVGSPVVAKAFQHLLQKDHQNSLVVEHPQLEDMLRETLQKSVHALRRRPFDDESFESSVRVSESPEFIAGQLVPLVRQCLSPEPDKRPRNTTLILQELARMGVPPSGRMARADGIEVKNAMFPNLTD